MEPGATAPCSLYGYRAGLLHHLSEEFITAMNRTNHAKPQPLELWQMLLQLVDACGRSPEELPVHQALLDLWVALTPKEH